MRRLLVLVFALTACRTPPQVSADKSTLSVTTTNPTTVYVAFGADSQITQSDWSSFCTGSSLVCSFPLASRKDLPLSGKYLDATLSFDAPVGCGTTKAELNLNNPAWYDTADVSLVDGFSNKIQISFSGRTLGPATGGDNSKTFGVFPLGCDVCVARQQPPCDIAPSPTPGSAGCKSGPDQYHPDVPCQAQGTVKGGGQNAVTVSLLP